MSCMYVCCGNVGFDNFFLPRFQDVIVLFSYPFVLFSCLTSIFVTMILLLLFFCYFCRYWSCCHCYAFPVVCMYLFCKCVCVCMEISVCVICQFYSFVTVANTEGETERELISYYTIYIFVLFCHYGEHPKTLQDEW